MGERLRHVLQRPARHAGGFQLFQPMRGRRAAQRRLQDRRDGVGGLAAQRVAGKARIVLQRRKVERVEQRRPQRIIARRDDDMAVLALIGGKGRDRRVARAERPRRDARHGIARDGILQDRDLAVEHRHIDELPRARLFAVVQRLKMPMTVNSPAVMSPIEVPTRVGLPPGQPVTLMMPPIACTTMS